MIGKARGVLIGAILAVAVANIAQFLPIDQSAGPRYAALGRLPTSDLQTSLDESPDIAEIYNLFFQLSEIAPESQLLIADDSIFSLSSLRDNALGFGDAQRVELAKYNEDVTSWLDTEVLTEQAPHDELEATGKVWLPHLGNVGWRIIRGDCAPGKGEPGRSFAVMRLTANGTHSLLLIETCQIPEGVVSLP